SIFSSRASPTRISGYPFCYDYLPHRLLPSFPTRRSSDLRLLAALEKAGGVTGDAPAPLVDPALLDVAPEIVAPDLVQVPPDFDPAALSADLASAVNDHRESLESGDAAGPAEWVAPGARDAVSAAVALLAGGLTSTRVVGLAAIGRQQMVKLRIESPRAIGF